MDYRAYYLELLGIQQWVTKKPNPDRVATVVMPTGDKIMAPASQDKSFERPIAEIDWAELEARVNSCTACDLYKTRTRPVFGVGNKQADLLLVGEAPGANEDKQGEPFVGRAGKLLNSMLQAIGLSRSEVYIANILKSRPPNNRDPNPTEVAACTPFLQRQITLLSPKLMLALGRIASQYLLATNEAMASLRGREFKYGPMQTPLLVTYHPAYLLRAPREKRKAWEDLERVAKLLATLRN